MCFSERNGFSFRPRRPPAAAREAPRGSGPRGSRTRPLRGTWRPPPAAPRRRQPHPRHLRRGGMNGLVRVGAQARACSRAGCRGIGREAAATLRTHPGTASQAAAALVGRHPLRYGSLPSSFRYPAFFSLRNLSGRLALTFCPHLGTTVRDKKLGKVSLSAPRTVVCFYSATSCLPRPDDWRRVFEKGGVIGALLTSALAASVPVALHCLFFPTRSGTLDD